MMTFSHRHNARRNVIYLNTHNSLEHELKKTEVCYFLKKQGIEFYTEAELIGAGRADIFVVDIPVAIEIVKTEPPESIIEKSRSYPCRIIPIKTTQPWDEKLIN